MSFRRVRRTGISVCLGLSLIGVAMGTTCQNNGGTEGGITGGGFEAAMSHRAS